VELLLVGSSCPRLPQQSAQVGVDIGTCALRSRGGHLSGVRHAGVFLAGIQAFGFRIDTVMVELLMDPG